MKKLLQNIVFATATSMAAGSAMAAVTFYEGEHFSGRPFSVNGAVPDFRAYDFNDRALSMVVQGSPVLVCVDINFGGNCQVFNPGSYPSLVGPGWALAISSVRPAGYDPRGQHQLGNEPIEYQQPGYDQRGYDQRGYQPGYDQRGNRDRWQERQYQYNRGY